MLLYVYIDLFSLIWPVMESIVKGKWHHESNLDESSTYKLLDFGQAQSNR